MANDTEKVEGAPQIEGIPEPQISGEEPKQSLGQSGESAVSLEEVKEMIQTEVQSIKDVRFGKYGTRLDNLEEAVSKYDELIAGGMSKGDALASMQREQEFADIKQQLAQLGVNSPEGSVGTGQMGWVEARDTILGKAGIEKNDPRHTEFLTSNTFASHDEYVKALEAESFQWVQADAKKPQPSSSTIATVVDSTAPKTGDFPGVSTEELGAKILELNREPTKNKAEVDRLTAELVRRDYK